VLYNVFTDISTKKFMCNIDRLITLELRFFESHQCAVILLRKRHSCSCLPNLFSFELEVKVEIYLTYFDLLSFELNNYFSKNAIHFRLDLNLPRQLSIFGGNENIMCHLC